MNCPQLSGGISLVNKVIRLIYVTFSVVHLLRVLVRLGTLTKCKSLSVLQAKKKRAGYTVTLNFEFEDDHIFAKYFSQEESKAYEQYVYESGLLSDLRNEGPVVMPDVVFSSNKIIASRKFDGIPLIDLFRRYGSDIPSHELICKVHENLGFWLGKLHTLQGNDKSIFTAIKADSKFPPINEVIKSAHATGFFRRGFAHGDFSYHQVLVSEDFNSIFVCDFEDFYFGSTAVDLATYFSKLQLLCKESVFFSPELESRCRTSLLSGYRTHIKMDNGELELITSLEEVLIQRYKQIRDH